MQCSTIFCIIKSIEGSFINIAFDFGQSITYICKDGMKMKGDFHKTSKTIKCNANNTFDSVDKWPECISSKCLSNLQN